MKPQKKLCYNSCFYQFLHIGQCSFGDATLPCESGRQCFYQGYNQGKKPHPPGSLAAEVEKLSRPDIRTQKPINFATKLSEFQRS